MSILTANLRKQIVECEAQLEALREEGRFDSSTFDDVSPARALLQNRLAGLRTTLADVEFAEGIRRPAEEQDPEWMFPPHRQAFTPEPEESTLGTIAAIILVVMGAMFLVLNCTGTLTR